jgi:hypothetical protein
VDDLINPDPAPAPEAVDPGQPVDAAEPLGEPFGAADPQDSAGRADERVDRDIPEPPDSGDAAVDELTAAAAAAVSDTLEEQVAAYERAHRTLQDRLADVEG